jgi:chromosome partitioning protein
MIVTILDCAPPGGRELVAKNLALLRARAGRDVLLVDTGAGQRSQHWGGERVCARLHPTVAVRVLAGLGGSAELERLRTGFDDVVIIADGCGGPACRWASAHRLRQTRKV